MSDKPVIHGREHHPFGTDPNYPSPWVAVTSTNHTAWSSGTNYSQGQLVGDGVFNYICVLANGPASTVSQPGVTAGWLTYWAIYQPIFQNGWANIGGGLQGMQFRLTIGTPNVLDRLTASVLGSFSLSGFTYSDHQTEIQGSASGGNLATLVFYLPPTYAPANKLRLPASDDVGGFIPFTVTSNGGVYKGLV